MNAKVPVTETVRSACELLGMDPLYVANEGRFVAFVPRHQAELALKVLPAASMAGTVLSEATSTVYLRSLVGGDRILHMISGEQLPRIC